MMRLATTSLLNAPLDLRMATNALQTQRGALPIRANASRLRQRAKKHCRHEDKRKNSRLKSTKQLCGSAEHQIGSETASNHLFQRYVSVTRMSTLLGASKAIGFPKTLRM
jgi:hypothetical protein